MAVFSVDSTLSSIRSFAATMCRLYTSNVDKVCPTVILSDARPYYVRGIGRGTVIRRLASELLDRINANEEPRMNDLRHVLTTLVQGSSLRNCRISVLFNEWNGSPAAQSLLDKLRKAILSCHRGYCVSGTYDSATDTITLYRQPDNDRYAAVLAHEFFHALHHRLLTDDGPDYYYTVVKESLATYFEAAYIRYAGLSVDDPVALAANDSPIFFPYSGSKYLDDRSFLDVLKASHLDFSEALYLFIPKDEADIIMKKEPYPIPVITRKRKAIDDIAPDDEADYSAYPSVYVFNGETWKQGNRSGNGLGRLVCAIVGEYVRNNKCSVYELANIFPISLNRHGVFQLVNDILVLGKDPSRYYMDAPIPVNGTVIAVTSQWDRRNVAAVVEIARQLGMDVRAL